MSRRANATFIGAFVVGALALAFLGLLIFGSGQYFSKQVKYVMYFEGSVAGLVVGAPVSFKGVQIGTVTDISVNINRDNLDVTIPVYVEIEPDSIHEFEKDSGWLSSKAMGYFSEVTNERVVQELIKRGLRAQLNLQSFVTGRLYIELDFHPESPINLAKDSLQYSQIPTIPSGLEEITRTLEQIPIKEIIDASLATLKGVEKFVNSPELKSAVSRFNNSLAQLEQLLTRIDGEIQPIASDTQQTLKAIRDAFAQARETLSTIESLSQDDSSLGFEITQTLGDLSEAAKTIRSLADYLERHPESLLQGK